MTLPYRPNVCILLFNKEKKLFLGERYHHPGIFQFPQGGVEDDAPSLEENVLREIEEELGVDRRTVEIVEQLDATHRYDYDHTPVYAHGKWRGQDQTFWLVEYLGDPHAINVATAHPEFQSYIWVTPAEVRKRVPHKKMIGYEEPLREFEEYLVSMASD